MSDIEKQRGAALKTFLPWRGYSHTHTRTSRGLLPLHIATLPLASCKAAGLGVFGVWVIQIIECCIAASTAAKLARWPLPGCDICFTVCLRLQPKQWQTPPRPIHNAHSTHINKKPLTPPPTPHGSNKSLSNLSLQPPHRGWGEVSGVCACVCVYIWIPGLLENHFDYYNLFCHRYTSYLLSKQKICLF